MCTPVYGRKFVKASQFTMCRRFFLFVSFYNATDPWLLSVLSVPLARSFSICVCVCSTTGLWRLWWVFFYQYQPEWWSTFKPIVSWIFFQCSTFIFLFFFSFSFFFCSSSIWCVSYLLSAWCTWSHSTSEYTMFVLAFTIHIHWLDGSTSTTFYQHTNCPN